jgi:hypothetical protein
MRSIFLGVGAFLGRIDSETCCAFWADEPVDHGFDPARLITVDLSRAPSAVIAGHIPWDAIEVDDCFSGPNGSLFGTTLGPRWPELQLMGLVYLEESFWKRLPDAIRPPCPPTGVSGRPHEYRSALYWPDTRDPRAGNRYMGHHAEVLSEQDSLARVAVYPPGTSELHHARPTTMWIDLSAPDQCDAGSDSLTTIGVGPGPKQGALYLLCGSINMPRE